MAKFNSITRLEYGNTVLFLLIFLFLASFGKAHGASNNSAASGNWTTPGTWSTGVKPTSSQDVNVGSSHSIAVDQNLSITSASWVFNGPVTDATGGAAYTLSITNHSDLTIKSTFTLEGSGIVEDHGSLSISGVSGTTMTIGSLTLKDNVTINIAAGCTLIVNGTFTIQDHAALTLNGVLLINSTASASDHATIGGTTGFFHSTGAVSVSDHSTIFGSENQCPTGPCTATPGSPLPISLINFSAEKSGSSVKLIWSTATEVNNDYFAIEKSKNGATFVDIGHVKGSGTSSSEKKYSLLDDAPYEGNSYYRLKQTDFDGKNETFEMVAVYYERQPGGGCILKVFPNPCVGQCTVALTDCIDAEDPEINVELIDAAGNKVYSKIPYRDEKGSFNFQIDTENNLTPGVYIVRGINKKESYSQKLLVK